MEVTHFKSSLIEKSLSKMRLCFRFTGLYIAGQSSSKTLSRFIYIFNLVIANTALCGGLSYLVKVGLDKDKDASEIIFSAPSMMINFLAQAKAYLLIKNESAGNKLIDLLKENEARQKSKKSQVEQYEIAVQEARFLNIVYKILIVLYGALIVTFTVSPLFLTAVKYFQTGKVQLNLQFLVLYPFDPYQISVWPFAFLHQFWAECVISLDICTTDYFFFTCCTYIRIQFRLLRHDLENLILVTEESNCKVIEDEDFKDHFRDLIKWHQDLIESANLLEIIYSKSTLLNFLTSSLIICLTGFNVTMVSDAAFAVSFLSFLFVSLVQVFFLCFFADILMVSSMEISNAIYNCKWYMAEAKIAKKLLVVQARSQRPCKITAYGFADVSLNSFMRVLSTAWSYFALLQTMYGN